MRGGSAEGVLDKNTFTLTDSDGSHPVYPPNSSHEDPPDFRGKTLGQLHDEVPKYVRTAQVRMRPPRQLIIDSEYLRLNIILMKIYLKDQFTETKYLEEQKKKYENLFPKTD